MASGHPSGFAARSRVPIPEPEWCLPYPVDKICGENVGIAVGFAVFLICFMLVPAIIAKLKQHDDESEPKVQVNAPVVSTKAKTVQPPQEKAAADDDNDAEKTAKKKDVKKEDKKTK
ncbi:unnamed protein product [Aphanomyces euteiches]|uniref:Uncharacterized protein n=1 Tax=Aphanomyces euteiches TaxID=100861 RepID=A0A6G0XIL6_9STRA|nr:hypothetical protein Ae201684_004375 [Aphanomyces euteiches]KAH9093920.1 hypothetical protein Ae201684P_016540 [Aphanomyces euteiches]KAH9126401.1 hypothetical protein AeMF1_003174 [Aphanomyces euteiches]KAH9140327.1 hypothetical protein LEN26_005284 [Aphanomyces euteiches]KAH9152559.1 hypothetical protein AeRB84_005031 [Aphanomyces euteiches]